ncbi:KELT protein [Plasmodium brasilianum]|uniref:KELT protein n=1 Tax=Plasmodium brasilianum TaxID=5824 RepID=A0ACB9Y711_PLABR|nr:KELT protein [Plasmodium brasilianum]
MRYLYKLTIALLCIYKYCKINKSIKKIFLAEKQLEPELKSDDEENDYNEETLTNVLRVLSIDVEQGKVEYEGMEKDDELKETEAVEEYTGRDEEVELEELGTSKGYIEGYEDEEMENLGAVGGYVESDTYVEFEDLEEVKEIDKNDSDCLPYSTRRKIREKEIEVKSKRRHQKKLQESIGRKEEIKTPESEAYGITMMTKYLSYVQDIKINDEDGEEFQRIITESTAMNYDLDFTLIVRYFNVGISGEENISKLNREYPIYKGKKIDFENIDKPFGVSLKNLKNVSKEELCGTLFFDDFIHIPLSNILKEVKVGNLTIEKILFFYKVRNINFIVCNSNILSFLKSQFSDLNLETVASYSYGLYSNNEENDIFNFYESKFFSIKENNNKLKSILDDFKKSKELMEVTEEQLNCLRKIIFNLNMDITYMNIIIFSLNIKKSHIVDDLKQIHSLFPLNKEKLERDEIILTTMHYSLSYCLHLIKPLFSKYKNNEILNYVEFFGVSSILNENVVFIEFLQHNSEFYKIFCKLYNSVDQYLPRMKSYDDIEPILNFILIRLHIITVIFNMVKLLLNRDLCHGILGNYEEVQLPIYKGILLDSENILKTAEEMLE